jgi:hypothetical protein
VRGRRRVQRVGNRLQHPLDVLENLVVPKSQHAIATVYQPLIANRIAFVGRVLTAVDFNNKPPLAADKINDEWSNRLLTDKLAAVQ